MATSDNALLQEADAVLNEFQSLSDDASSPASEQALSWWSTTNAMTMCAVLLVFGLLVMLIAAYLIRNGTETHSVLRILGTFLVIIMATFLVVAGYTHEQLGAPLGLLGTIVGYLLGRQTSGDSDSSRAPQRSETTEI